VTAETIIAQIRDLDLKELEKVAAFFVKRNGANGEQDIFSMTPHSDGLLTKLSRNMPIYFGSWQSGNGKMSRL